jgi:uncharacterized membrane protein HdeD (DUF308 family)
MLFFFFGGLLLGSGVVQGYKALKDEDSESALFGLMLATFGIISIVIGILVS